jgi:RND superfamily putative drug exporter
MRQSGAAPDTGRALCLEGNQAVVVGVFAAIGRFAVRFRWFIVAAWVVAAFAVSAALPSLSSVTQNDNTNFLPASTPSVHASNLASAFQKANQINLEVIAYRPSGALTTADTTALDGLTSALHGVSGVTTVKDLGRSANGSAEEFEVLAAQPGGMNGEKDLVGTLRTAITKASLPSDLTAHLAGDVATAVDNQAKSGSAGSNVEILSELFIIVLLFLIFRSLLAPFVTLIPATLVVVISGPLVAEATHAGLKVSSLAQLMLIVLVLGAGTDYGLFLVFRVRENLRAGLDKQEAVVTAVSRVGESITFSALTVIAALLSLLAASFGVYSNLGVPLAIGIALMLIAGLTLLPTLLAILGRAVFWPTKPRAGDQQTGLWGRLATRIVRRPAAVLSIGVVLFGALALGALGYKSAGFADGSGPPAGSDSAAGTAALTKYFPRVSADPTLLVYKMGTSVWTDATPLAVAQQRLTAGTIASTPSQFTTVVGPLDPAGRTLTPAEIESLHATLGDPANLPSVEPAGSTVPPSLYRAYRTTAQYISADGLTVQFAVGLKAGDPQGTAALNAVPTIRIQAAAVATAIHATDSGVEGTAPGLYDVSSVSSNDLRTVIPIAIAIIGVLLALVMRSLVAPLYLILSVGLSYLAALGLAVLLFIKLGHSGGLTFILPFLMFLFLLALGEDYNILVMTRIREEAHHLPLRQAVSRAIAATGTTVTSAGLVLAGTFAVFAIAGGSGNSQIRDIGVGLAAGILMDTFLVRTLLVPSTVVLLGRWNWWPSRLVDHHDSLEQSEPDTESDTYAATPN